MEIVAMSGIESQVTSMRSTEALFYQKVTET